jgi:hypothetical protein
MVVEKDLTYFSYSSCCYSLTIMVVALVDVIHKVKVVATDLKKTVYSSSCCSSSFYSAAVAVKSDLVSNHL